MFIFFSYVWQAICYAFCIGKGDKTKKMDSVVKSLQGSNYKKDISKNEILDDKKQKPDVQKNWPRKDSIDLNEGNKEYSVQNPFEENIGTGTYGSLNGSLNRDQIIPQIKKLEENKIEEPDNNKLEKINARKAKIKEINEKYNKFFKKESPPEDKEEGDKKSDISDIGDFEICGSQQTEDPGQKTLGQNLIIELD